MMARQIHRAGRNAEILVNEMDDAVRQAVREKRAEVERAVFAQAAGDVDARIFLKGREANVGIGLVVAQQHVEFRLVLLDEIVFERQGLALVVHDDVVEVGDFAHQRAGLGIGPARFQEVGAHAGAQRAGLADVEDRAQRVLEQVHAGLGGQIARLFPEFHGRSYN